MNAKERLACFVLVATLAIGIIAGLLDRDENGKYISYAGRASEPGAPTENDSYLPLDLNTASVGELMALPGIGEKRAAAIVAWREENGPFGCVDDLAEVRGIGPATVDRLRPFVRAGAGCKEAPG